MAFRRVLTVIFIFVYNTIILYQSSASTLPASPKTSMHVYLEIQSNCSLSNSEALHGKIKSILNDSKEEIRNCSTKNDLDIPATEFLTIKSLLRNLSNSVDSLLPFLTPKKSFGVQYNNFRNIFKHKPYYPKNCREVQKNGNNVSGVYVIHPKYARAPFPVLCDMETRGGGWIHIQKRFDGSQDFSLGWRQYKFGFGDLDGEFWLGLENIHLLTSFDITELLVEISDRDNISVYAQYKSFAVGPEPDGYKLSKLSGYSGNAGDSLTYHLGQKFSTSDLDFTDACTSRFYGGWWYNDCTRSHLNGKYINIDLPAKIWYRGLHWDSFRGPKYSHSKSRMLIRPAT